MKVAIVHEWLESYAGSERVLEQLLHCYPQADLYAIVDVLPAAERAFLGGRPVRTTFIQRLPFARRRFRHYLPLMPLAVEQLDLRDYDLVLSSSHAVAKGVLTSADQLHVCYCYSPMRYAWDQQAQYLRAAGLERGLKSWAARWMLHRLRQWDLRAAAGVDRFVAVSRHIARRIRKTYRREAEVIYPPVDVQAFPLRETASSLSSLREDGEAFYLAVARLVPYKRVDVVVEAFAATPQRRLVVIGDGPEARRVRARSAPNITFLAHQPVAVLRDHLQRARALVFAGEEDFGITLVEAQACGTPVIAYGRGGAREIVRGPETPAPTGRFFAEQTAAALCAALDAFEAGPPILPQACRANAERFGIETFRCEITAFIDRAWQDFRTGLA